MEKCPLRFFRMTRTAQYKKVPSDRKELLMSIRLNVILD